MTSARVWATAVVAGLVTGVVVVNAMHALHVGCDWVVGGEAGSGAWLCTDGIGYALPTLASAAAAAALVLLVGYVRRR